MQFAAIGKHYSGGGNKDCFSKKDALVDDDSTDKSLGSHKMLVVEDSALRVVQLSTSEAINGSLM
jgi:hypothetical protein